MPQLTSGEFSIVYNFLSFTLAAMFASFIFFILSRDQVSHKYRGALTLSALIVAIACYHYFRIFDNWNSVYTVINDVVTATGKPFNSAYRYVDWFLTVPLLVIELIAVLNIAVNKRRGLTARLVVAAVAMIALGYPGEVASDVMTRVIWGSLSTIPFLYILYELFIGLSPVIASETGQAKVLICNIRLLLVGTWGFYPIVFMLPIFVGTQTSTAVVWIQVGYCIADVLAKCGYGLMIYAIAKTKTDSEAIATS